MVGSECIGSQRIGLLALQCLLAVVAHENLNAVSFCMLVLNCLQNQLVALVPGVLTANQLILHVADQRGLRSALFTHDSVAEALVVGVQVTDLNWCILVNLLVVGLMAIFRMVHRGDLGCCVSFLSQADRHVVSRVR